MRDACVLLAMACVAAVFFACVCVGCVGWGGYLSVWGWGCLSVGVWVGVFICVCVGGGACDSCVLRVFVSVCVGGQLCA